MISIVQNFICTEEERFKVLEKELPKLGEVFHDCPFYVNYNTTVNLDRVYNLYKQHINKLEFFNNLEPEWATLTLALSEQVETPYLAYLCEDAQVHVSKEEIWTRINEFIKEECDYLLLTKLEKYLRPEYRLGSTLWNGIKAPAYNQLKYGYWYLGKFAPHKRISTDAIYRTEWYKERVKEFIVKGDSCLHEIPIKDKRKPNYYEGYYDFNNGTARFSDMKFYIPNYPIITEFDTVKQNRK